MIKAIDFATRFGWNNVSIKTDSSFVSLAAQDPKVIPWSIRTILHNCLVKIRQLRFHISHIFRKENQCTYLLTSLTLNSNLPLF